MRLFAQTSKVLYKNLFLMMGYTVFFCYTFWEYRKSFLAMSTYIPNQPAIGFLSVTLSMSLLCTVFFLFFSYVLFAKPQKAGLEECLQATKNGQGKFVGSQFVWIVFLIFVFTVMSFVFNWLYPTTALAGGLYLRHMIGCLFVYMFLVPLTGALLGMAAALSLKPLFAYSIMVLFALFSSPLGGMLAFLVSEATREAVDIFFL